MAVRGIELTSRKRRAPPNHRAQSSSCIPHLNTISTNTTAARLQACARGYRGQAVQHPLQSITHQSNQLCQGTQHPNSPDHTAVSRTCQSQGRMSTHPTSALCRTTCMRAAGKRQNAAGQEQSGKQETCEVFPFPQAKLGPYRLKAIIQVCFGTALSWTHTQPGLQQDTFTFSPFIPPPAGNLSSIKKKKTATKHTLNNPSCLRYINSDIIASFIRRRQISLAA